MNIERNVAAAVARQWALDTFARYTTWGVELPVQWPGGDHTALLLARELTRRASRQNLTPIAELLQQLAAICWSDLVSQGSICCIETLSTLEEKGHDEGAYAGHPSVATKTAR